jgi:hypothetical protein
VGTTIQATDLGLAELSADPTVSRVPANQRPGLVGLIATTDLKAGSVLVPGQIADSAAPADGSAIAVLALPASRMPAVGLHRGDSILVVSTPAAEAATSDGPPTTFSATVVRVGEPDVNGLIPVDVTVAAADGPALAARAATGRIAVVIQPRPHG